MPATTFNNCKKLLKQFEKGEEVGFQKLNSLILQQIGSDPRTTHRVLRLMLDTKLIKDIGNFHFKVI